MRGRAARLTACSAAMLLWSASFVGTRIAYGCLTPLWLGFVRFVLASVAFVPLLVMRRRGLPHGRDLALVALSGLVGITLYFAAENWGVGLTSASNASLVVGSFPAIAILVESVVRREVPKVRELVGAIVALAGVALLTVGEATEGADVLLGNAVLMFAGILWGIYNLLVQGVSEEVPVLELTACQAVFGALFFLPLLPLETIPVLAWSPEVAGAVTFLSLGCSVVAYLLYNWSLEGLPSSVCAALLNLIPVFGIILSALILGEPVTPAKLVGGAVVLTGIFAGSRRARKA